MFVLGLHIISSESRLSQEVVLAVCLLVILGAWSLVRQSLAQGELVEDARKRLGLERGFADEKEDDE